MKTIEINLYKFAELSDEAKEVAVNEWLKEEPSYQWWDDIYEDAKQVGIIINSFDPDRFCKGKIYDTEQTAHDIIKQHGEQCETYKTAADYLAKRDAVITEWPCDDEGQYMKEDDLDAKLDDMGEEFEKSILEDYRIILRNEYEYITSTENAIESIKANDYDFTEDGKMY